MLREIEHPFIIKLEDVFLDDKHVYIVLELVRGGDLFDRIVDRGRYSEDDARELMVRVLTSVSYLHSKDIVHRDLKPENILLVSKENHYDVKITDFGLAKQANKDGLKTFCGTPQYFAPEVLKRRNTVRGAGRYGKEADLWSLGVILYITLSGTHPFHDSTLFDQISKAHYSFDGPEWTNISEDAKDLVKRLLMRNPKKRLTALQALEHPFFRGRGVELTELAGEPAVTVPAPSEDGRLSVAPHSSTDNILDEDDISDFSSDESDCDSDQSDGENPELAPPPVSKRRRKGIAPKKVSGRKPSSEGTSPKPLPMTAAPRRAGSGSRGRLSAPAETRLK
jgi:serine/threonine protein kinase